MNANRRTVTLLFIHDGTPDHRQVEYLRDAGLDVLDVHGAEAATTATTVQPDIIVMDFSADGDTLRALKRNPATKDIPVIALVELLNHA